MYNWLKGVFDKEYSIEKVIKRSEDKSVILMKNKENGVSVIVKEYEGSCGVYKKLVNINHENLPMVYEAVANGDKSMVVEEYIEGITVGDVLETGLYTEEGVKVVISQLICALEVLHGNGIVHRDIKPENIIIDSIGTVKLIDFNISRINNNTRDKDTRILGTTGFAAPEQYGISETDHRSDIYALGILINVMLTGEHPAKKLCDGMWGRIVDKCTRINPGDRYNSVREILS